METSKLIILLLYHLVNVIKTEKMSMFNNDNGMGINFGEDDHSFDPFSSAKDDFSNFGGNQFGLDPYSNNNNYMNPNKNFNFGYGGGGGGLGGGGGFDNNYFRTDSSDSENDNDYSDEGNFQNGNMRSVKDDENDLFPPVACPDIFKYDFDEKYGGYFGSISIPKPEGEILYETEVNMTINRPVTQQDNIKLQLMSTANDIYYGETLNWAVKLPFQDLLPKLTQIMFNGMVICSNHPDPLIPGVTQSSMWAKSTISSGKKDSQNNQGMKKRKRRMRKKKRKNRRGLKARKSYARSFGNSQ